MSTAAHPRDDPWAAPPRRPSAVDGSSQENGGSRDAGSHGENGSSHGENGTAQDTASSSTESLLALSVLSKDQLDALYEPLPGGRRDGPEIAARALSTFTFIDKSEYKGAADGLANDQDESIPCDCSYTPTPGGDGVEDSEDACGERCINRALKMECRRGECPCGEHCHNQRFSRREYAPIEIIIADGKGFGLRAKSDIPKNTFVIEYVGEVLSQAAFVKRTKQYAEMGQRHFYFMSLKHGEFVDATRRGGIARFMNHSCNSNCHVEKWIVNGRFRMGIFTQRTIRAGEELTFDYKFERYGASPQECLCGEPNCKKFIGTERKAADGAPLNFEGNESDSDDDFDEDEVEERLRRERQAASRKNRLTGNDDDYEGKVKGIDKPETIRKMVAVMFRSVNKPHRVARILDRLVATEDVPCLRQLVQFHGLLVLKSWLRTLGDNVTVVRKIVSILGKLPIQTRNTVESSKIEPLLEQLKTSNDVVVSALAAKILIDWEKLETVYRIPKASRTSTADDSSAAKRRNSLAENDADTKRMRADNDRPEPATISNFQQFAFKQGWASGAKNDDRRVSPDRKFSLGRDRASSSDGQKSTESTSPNVLPPDWSSTTAPDGRVYYYNRITKATTWTRPEVPPAIDLPPPAPAPVDTTNEDIARVLERARQQMNAEKERREEEERQRRQEKKDREKAKLAAKEKEREAKLAKEKEREAKRRRHSESASISAPNTPGALALSTSGVELKVEMKKELREELSAVVIKYFSHYREQLGTEEFKKHARKITHAIIDKESREKEIVSVNDELKRKIRKFVDSYASKLLATLVSAAPSSSSKS